MADAPRTAVLLEDEDLLRALRAGQESAYERLVQRHAGPLLAVARRLLRNEADAQDAVQDAFLSAFRALPEFQGQSRLGTWLHRIVVNSALMKQRSRARKPEQPIEGLLPSFDDTGHRRNPGDAWPDDPYQAAEAGELRRLVRDCIERLPESYRTILLLRDIEGLDTAEAARLLEVSENTIKVRLHRARQALRELLDPYLQGRSPCSSPAKS